MFRLKNYFHLEVTPAVWRTFTLVFLCTLYIELTVSQGTSLSYVDNHLGAGVNQENYYEEAPEFPKTNVKCPQCKLLTEMPMELAEKINLVEDVDVFVHNFVDESLPLSNTSTLVQHPTSRKRRAVRDQPRQATCQPIDTIVSLVPPEEKDPTVFYFPSCILLKQCGGCCAHTGTTCSPTDETERQVTIKKTKFTGGNKFQSLGEVTVSVKEHNKCRCQCKKVASDCNSLQRFISNQCRCECSNIQEAADCAGNPLKLWDIKSCSCVCRDEKECPNGLEYDQSSCSCQTITEDFLNFEDHTYNEMYETTSTTK